MEKNRSLGFVRPSSWLITGLLALGVLSGCASTPRLSLHHDPLSAEEHVTLGNAYADQSKKDLATQQYKSALRKDRTSIPALMTLGTLAFEEKRWDEARGYFRRILKVQPANAAAVNNLAMVDLAEGKPLDAAAKQVHKALESAGSLRPYLLDTLANIALRQGRLDDAEEILKQARKEAPANNPEFERHLAASHQKLAQAKQP